MGRLWQHAVSCAVVVLTCRFVSFELAYGMYVHERPVVAVIGMACVACSLSCSVFCQSMSSMLCSASNASAYVVPSLCMDCMSSAPASCERILL